MSQLTKRLFAIVLVTLVGFHFLMVLVYGLHYKTGNEKLNFVNKRYVYPVFHQNWNLFVPAPNADRKLFVRYKTDKGFANWVDILSTEVIRQKQTKVLGNEARVLLLSNSLIYELNSLDTVKSCVFNDKPNNAEFKVLQFEIEKYLRLEFQLSGSTEYELLLMSEEKQSIKSYYIKSLTIN